MKASDFVALYLAARGVTHAFELVGGMITHLLDSLGEKSNISIISCHHEQAAAFAAEGYARVTGVPGVALATSGPGATNLLTSIGSCFFDSTPTVFITGQVNTHELKGQRRIRQLGFQETDIVAMAKPICKSAVQVHNVLDLPEILDNAFRFALEGRQGPCLVDIPMNIQSADIDYDIAFKYLHSARHHSNSHRTTTHSISNDLSLNRGLSDLLAAIPLAKRPLVLMGGGCASTHNRCAAKRIIELLDLPVVFSLMAVDLLPVSHVRRVGFIGSYGNRWANKVLGDSDLLIVIGSRLDIKQTGSDVDSFCDGKDIWQFDLDSDELGVRVQSPHSFCISVRSLSLHLESLSIPIHSPHHQDWFLQINTLKKQYPSSLEYSSTCGEVNPIEFLQSLSSSFDLPTQYVTDVGQHQMWAAQSLQFKDHDRFFTSGGMGAMGFGLPAAIGSALSNPDVLTILISGDGSFQLNIQEMETLRRNLPNLKIILFNNRCHGMVRQFQESYFHGRLLSTVVGYSAPDFVAISTAYGIPARVYDISSSIDTVLHWLLQSNQPALLEVPLSSSSKVYPKLAFGRKFGEMEPDVSPTAMEST